MSLPNEPDFAFIKMRTATGPDVYTLLCGIESVTVNENVNTSERFRRDCATPNLPGQRKLKATGRTWEISGSGVINVDLEVNLSTKLGVIESYHVEFYKDDGTSTGDLMGTYAGTAMMTTRNQSLTTEGDSSVEITLQGEGLLVWTAAT
ncbi:phage tail tube protein [Sphingobium sp. H39-3-25]|uniref:phage tail tube protein n=1 Tax=Sphingobium arseniciresistens TaxID=3030834 RepID=UPI0023B8EE02|nr:phage tail tube protein [Sphingobium arseniciresistens]